MNIEKPLTEKGYREIALLSSSNLRDFAESRKKFYKTCVLGEKEEDEYSKAMTIGNLVHTYLLEPEKFEEKYYISICQNVPTENMLKFVLSLFKYTQESVNEEGEMTKDFMEIATMAHGESGYKIGLDAVLKKFAGTDAEKYYIQLREASTKNLEVVCLDDINIANKIVEMVKNDPFVGKYFKEPEDGIEYFYEVKVEEFDLHGMKMKAMLDIIEVNHHEKYIQLVDLKVVYDNQDFYRNYYLKRKAYIQAYTYQKALRSGKIDLGFAYEDYTVLLPIFLAVDSGCFYAPIRYMLSNKDMEKAFAGFVENGRWYSGVGGILEEINWSLQNGIWNTDSYVYEENGFKSLK